MGEAVEKGRRHFCVAEDGCPFAEAEVRGDDDASALVALARDVWINRRQPFMRNMLTRRKRFLAPTFQPFA